MQKVFIHVGLHKTGTTTFQKSIWPQLKKFTYLSRPYTQHNQAFNRLQYADDIEYKKEDVIQEVQKFGLKNLFFSDESFSGKPVTFSYINRSMIAERISSIWPHAEVIIFLRDQKDFLRSIYSSYIKMPYGTNKITEFLWKPIQDYSFEEYLQEGPVTTRSMPYNTEGRFLNIEILKYNQILNLYQQRFSRVHVFLYEDFQNYPEECLEKLSQILDEKLEYRPEIKLNRSLVMRDMELIRILNRLQPIIGKYPAKILKNIQLFKHFGNKTSRGLNDAIEEFVGDYYSDDNSALRERLSHVDFTRFPTAYR